MVEGRVVRGGGERQLYKDQDIRRGEIRRAVKGW